MGGPLLRRMKKLILIGFLFSAGAFLIYTHQNYSESKPSKSKPSDSDIASVVLDKRDMNAAMNRAEEGRPDDKAARAEHIGKQPESHDAAGGNQDSAAGGNQDNAANGNHGRAVVDVLQESNKIHSAKIDEGFVEIDESTMEPDVVMAIRRDIKAVRDARAYVRSQKICRGKDGIPRACSSEQKVSEDGDRYTDVLLRAPQQDADFYHDSSKALFLADPFGSGSSQGPDFWQPSSTVTADRLDDRILGQMRYQPPGKRERKTLLVMSGESPQSQRLVDDKCPVTECDIIRDRSHSASADAILWQHSMSFLNHKRSPNQIWIAFFLESPLHTPNVAHFGAHVNWTATYRGDSTIVAPYERFTLYDENVHVLEQTKNYATDKKKMVAWFVSNCGAGNNRLGYARELGKYVGVDIYGACGTKSCSRGSANHCFDVLSKEYKFYLSFENSNCRDYISEKFFLNGLRNDVVPIVMGAHPDEYERSAPFHSYIHVDDFTSPKSLAAYLTHLDKEDALYNSYFAWKGTGTVVNTFFWCRVCMMMHEADRRPPRHVPNLNEWWRGSGVCLQRKRDPASNQLEVWPRWRPVPVKGSK